MDHKVLLRDVPPMFFEHLIIKAAHLQFAERIIINML